MTTAAVARMVEGPVTAMVRGSVLQMHPRTVLILDQDAASELKMSDYYNWIYDHKPDRQKY